MFSYGVYLYYCMALGLRRREPPKPCRRQQTYCDRRGGPCSSGDVACLSDDPIRLHAILECLLPVAARSAFVPYIPIQEHCYRASSTLSFSPAASFTFRSQATTTASGGRPAAAVGRSSRTCATGAVIVACLTRVTEEEAVNPIARAGAPE